MIIILAGTLFAGIRISLQSSSRNYVAGGCCFHLLYASFWFSFILLVSLPMPAAAPTCFLNPIQNFHPPQSNLCVYTASVTGSHLPCMTHVTSTLPNGACLFYRSFAFVQACIKNKPRLLRYACTYVTLSYHGISILDAR